MFSLDSLGRLLRISFCLLMAVCSLTPQTAQAEFIDVVDASFDTDSDGFDYVDDPFRNTNQPSYASGQLVSAGGHSGGGLVVTLGGIDYADIFGMSGGWRTDFFVEDDTIGTSVSFSYNLTQASDFESDEFSQFLVSLDGDLIGISPDDVIAEIVGDGNGGASQTTGWQTVTLDLGPLSAGNHSLTLGGYNNKKTWNNEITAALIDDVVVTLEFDDAEEEEEEEEEENNDSHTISSQPLHSHDDAEELSDGTMYRISSDLELAEEFGQAQRIGIRFPDLDIPHGATITAAEIIFTVDEETDELTTLEFQAEASDDAAPFSNTDFDISDRPHTDTSVEWVDIAPWLTVGEEHATPDLSGIIQEVIDRPNWQRGNALAVLIRGSGSRVAVSYNNNPDQAPFLVVDYTSDDPNEDPDDPSDIIISAQPQNTDDDAEESLDGTMSLFSSDLELIDDFGEQIVGIRFPHLLLPQGATIIDAYIEFTTDEVSSDPTSLVFQAEASDDALAFGEESGDLSNRPLTANQVEWTDIAPWDLVDEVHETPNLAPIVQEVVDRSGWQAGNALVVAITGQGARIAVSYDKDPNLAPRFVVHYTTDAETQTVRIPIDQPDDDAEEWLDGTMYVDSSDLELTTDHDANVDQLIGLRFTGVAVPRGAQIIDAYLEFTVDELSSEATSLEILAEASPDADPFSPTAFDLSNRSTTATSVDWDDVAAWDVLDAKQETPNFAEVIQEVIDQPDWQSGNAVAVFITGSGSRVAVSRDKDAELAPRLVIMYALP